MQVPSTVATVDIGEGETAIGIAGSRDMIVRSRVAVVGQASVGMRDSPLGWAIL